MVIGVLLSVLFVAEFLFLPCGVFLLQGLPTFIVLSMAIYIWLQAVEQSELSMDRNRL